MNKMEFMTTQTQIENAIKWIEALLSGDHKQGKHRLGNETMGFCCWGLGCKVVGKGYDPYNGWDDEFFTFVGFNFKSGQIRPYFYGRSSLDAVNDFTPAGFKRIGKYLIKHSQANFIKEVADGIDKHFKK